MTTTMNKDNLQQVKKAVSNVPLEQLYVTMSSEADGLYKQMITICTAFLGGTLLFFDKLFIGDVSWTLAILFFGWAALTYPLPVMILVRWKNVEAHRHILEYFKTESQEEYKKAVAIPQQSRRWTKSAIFSMTLGLVLIAIFTAINIVLQSQGDPLMTAKKDTSSQNYEKRSLDPSAAVVPGQIGQPKPTNQSGSTQQTSDPKVSDNQTEGGKD